MNLGGFIVGFVRGWEMTLICISSLPLLAAAGGIMGKILQKLGSIQEKAYESAGGHAEQCLTSIKTVKSLNGQDFEVHTYT